MILYPGNLTDYLKARRVPLQNQIRIRKRTSQLRQISEVIAMNKQIIEEYLDELDDLIQECKDLVDDNPSVGGEKGIMDNMKRIKSIADEVLDSV